MEITFSIHSLHGLTLPPLLSYNVLEANSFCRGGFLLVKSDSSNANISTPRLLNLGCARCYFRLCISPPVSLVSFLETGLSSEDGLSRALRALLSRLKINSSTLAIGQCNRVFRSFNRRTISPFFNP